MFRKFGKSRAIGLSGIVILAILSLMITGCGGCGEKKTVVYSTPNEKTSPSISQKLRNMKGVVPSSEKLRGLSKLL